MMQLSSVCVRNDQILQMICRISCLFSVFSIFFLHVLGESVFEDLP